MMKMIDVHYLSLDYLVTGRGYYEDDFKPRIDVYHDVLLMCIMSTS